MYTGSRPLSPHLQIYKPQLTAVLSIVHRLSGVALTAGTLVLVWWLIAAAAGPGPFADIQGIIGAWYGRLAMFGWTFALFFHLCNGVRHMFWDAGKGLELSAVYASGWTVAAAATALTLAAWVSGYAAMGAL
jgi:succinate dehydrogenase / fumarate reductase cytochrome b subunit